MLTVILENSINRFLIFIITIKFVFGDCVKFHIYIININELRTMHLAPHEILVALSVDFADGVSSERVELAVSTLEQTIKGRHPQVRRIFIEAQDKHDGMARRR